MSDGPLKILFLAAPSMPHARRWIAQLQERGHEVRAATLHEIPPGNADHTIALRTRGDVSRPTGPKDILAAIRPLRRMIASFEPDLTIAYYMTSYGLLAALVNAPCVIGATAGGDVLVDPYDSLFQRIRKVAEALFQQARAHQFFKDQPAMLDVGEHGHGEILLGCDR